LYKFYFYVLDVSFGFNNSQFPLADIQGCGSTKHFNRTSYQKGTRSCLKHSIS